MVERQLPKFLNGGGNAALEILEFDWSTSPVGRIEDWPVAMKTAVGMMVASHFPKAIFWGPDYIMLYNDAYGEIMREKMPAMGQPMHRVWAEVFDEVRPIAERAMQGEPTFLENFPLVVERSGQPEQCWFTFCYSPIRDENGHIPAFLNTVIETTPTVEAQYALRVQNAELAHRIQNTLAIVAGIARQTLRSAGTTDAAWAALSLRLNALGKAHELLRVGKRTQAAIGEVVQANLQAHGDTQRIRLSGPDLFLPERQALALSLAINELATNALKHGALASDEGHVTVTWDLTHDARFRLVWQEFGAGPVRPPTRSSFGTQLIEKIVPADFGGVSVLDFAEAGFRYELSSDLSWLEDDSVQPG